ncbi:histone-lysine N-methyltransferase 2D-like [Macrobrachium nipponense]|uniref:histone-lysine N-methyltransferase 2D-like n=1 Tax=Macrobrachium nipponense TaxID=159736 RepID=UPI0030C821F5
MRFTVLATLCVLGAALPRFPGRHPSRYVPRYTPNGKQNVRPDSPHFFGERNIDSHSSGEANHVPPPESRNPPPPPPPAPAQRPLPLQEPEIITNPPPQQEFFEGSAVLYQEQDTQESREQVLGSQERERPLIIPIVKDKRFVPEEGSFNLDVETANGIKVLQEITPSKVTGGSVTKGEYVFTHPDGTVHKVSYVADENGFQPSSDLLPKPHPIPPHALAQIEKAKLEHAKREKEEAVAAAEAAYASGEQPPVRYQGQRPQFSQEQHDGRFDYQQPGDQFLFQQSNEQLEFRRPNEDFRHQQRLEQQLDFQQPKEQFKFQPPNEVHRFQPSNELQGFQPPNNVHAFQQPNEIREFQHSNEAHRFQLPNEPHEFQQSNEAPRFQLPNEPHEFQQSNEALRFQLPNEPQEFQQSNEAHRFQLPNEPHEFQQPNEGHRFQLPNEPHEFQQPKESGELHQFQLSEEQYDFQPTQFSTDGEVVDSFIPLEDDPPVDFVPQGFEQAPEETLYYPIVVNGQPNYTPAQEFEKPAHVHEQLSSRKPVQDSGFVPPNPDFPPVYISDEPIYEIVSSDDGSEFLQDNHEELEYLPEYPDTESAYDPEFEEVQHSSDEGITSEDLYTPVEVREEPAVTPSEDESTFLVSEELGENVAPAVAGVPENDAATEAVNEEPLPTAEALVSAEAEPASEAVSEQSDDEATDGAEDETLVKQELGISPEAEALSESPEEVRESQQSQGVVPEGLPEEEGQENEEYVQENVTDTTVSENASGNDESLTDGDKATDPAGQTEQ